MIGGLGTAMPNMGMMSGGDSGFGGGNGFMWILALLILGRDGGLGLGAGSRVAADVGLTPAIQAIGSEVRGIQSSLDTLSLTNSIGKIPSDTASATVAALCPDLCSIKSTVSNQPNSAEFYQAINSVNSGISNLGTLLQGNECRLGNLVERTTNALAIQENKNSAETNLLVSNFGNGLATQMDRQTTALGQLVNNLGTQTSAQFCTLQHNLDNKFNEVDKQFCHTNSLIAKTAAEAALAHKDEVISSLLREKTETANAIMINGNSNAVNQGIQNVMTTVNNLAGTVSSLCDKHQTVENTVIQLGNNLNAIARGANVKG